MNEFLIDQIFLILSVASIINLNIILGDTSLGNPFKLEKPYDKKNYFKSTETHSQFILVNQCECKDVILNHSCTEKQILSGCINITPNKNIEKKSLQYLMVQNECYMIQYEIMKENKKLEQIFILKTEKIHDYALSLLIVIFIDFILTIILMIICTYFPFLLRIQNMIYILCTLGGIFYGLNFLNLYLFFLFCVTYFNDDTKDYLDFLKCNNVNKNGFRKYSFIENLKFHFNIFMVINILYLIIWIYKRSRNKNRR